MKSIKKKAESRREKIMEEEKQRKQREQREEEQRRKQISSESESKDEEEGIGKKLEEKRQLRNRELKFNEEVGSEVGSEDSSEDSFITPVGAKLTGSKSISSQNNSVSLQGIEDEDENNDEYNSLQDNPPILTDAKEFEHLGFKETIKYKPVTESIPININVCSDIFKNGSKVNNKYYFPSQFPNITAINNFSVKKGGKRKPNKYTKYKYKNKYTKNKTNKYKYKLHKVKTRKH